MQLVAAFIVPRRVRGNLRELLHYTMARFRTRARSLLGAWRSYVTPPVASSTGRTHPESGFGRPLRVERDDLVSLVRDVAREGGALRVRAPGGSMLPTIPRGALVRHKIFGVGQIEDGSGRGPDRKLAVRFPGHGLKTIVARFVERV